MRKNFLIIVCFYFLCLACTDSDDIILPACSVSNPAQDLEWLKTEIDQRNANPNEEMKYCYIVQAKLNGEDVFVYADCNPLVGKTIPIFNCEGTAINTQDNPVGFDNLQNKVIIWKGNNFVCYANF